MVKEPITGQEKRSNKITIIKQSLIDRIRQTEQNDYRKKKIALKSIEISHVEKDTIVTAHDIRKTEAVNWESLTRVRNAETKVRDLAKSWRVVKKLDKIKDPFRIKNATAIERITIKIVTTPITTKIKIVSISKRDAKKPITTDAEIEIKIARNIQTSPITKIAITYRNKTILNKEAIRKVVINQTNSLK